MPVSLAQGRLSDAPTAARFVEWNGAGVTVRDLGGRCATRVTRPEGFPDDASWIAASAGDFASFHGVPFDRTSKSVRDCPSETDASLLVRRDGGQREAALGRVRAAVADMALLDGELWMVGPDPVFRIGTPNLDGRVRPAVTIGLGSAAVDAFRLDQAALVHPYLSRAYPGCALPDLPEFEVVDPSILTHDPQLHGLAQVSMRLLATRRDFIGGADYRTMRRYARLRDLADGLPDPEGFAAVDRMDAMREAFDDFVEVSPPTPSLVEAVSRMRLALELREAQVRERALADDADADALVGFGR